MTQVSLGFTTLFSRICKFSIVLMLAFGSQIASAETRWNLAATWGGGPFLEDDAKGFAQLVEKLTGGSVKVQVFPGGTLGKPGKVSETVESEPRKSVIPGWVTTGASTGPRCSSRARRAASIPKK